MANNSERICVGIDENGLGPRLGPLIVTAITAHATDEGYARIHRAPRGKLAERLNDSKKLVSFADSALGEAWARCLVDQCFSPATARTPSELVRTLSLDPDATLTAKCPSEHIDHCWSTEREAFVAEEDLVEQLKRDLAWLGARGVRVTRAEVAIVCAERLNEAVANGKSRFDVDLHTMERLAIAARNRSDRDLDVTCGKVGGFDRYGDNFGPLSGYLHTAVDEGRARSEYAVSGLGRIAFVRDADAKHLLVCMASLVGKWVRDLLMARIVRYHQRNDAELPLASGYHDPVTTQFIAASALFRKKQRFPDVCFERAALGPKAPASKRDRKKVIEEKPAEWFAED